MAGKCLDPSPWTRRDRIRIAITAPMAPAVWAQDDATWAKTHHVHMAGTVFGTSKSTAKALADAFADALSAIMAQGMLCYDQTIFALAFRRSPQLFDAFPVFFDNCERGIRAGAARRRGVANSRPALRRERSPVQPATRTPGMSPLGALTDLSRKLPRAARPPAPRIVRAAQGMTSSVTTADRPRRRASCPPSGERRRATCPSERGCFSRLTCGRALGGTPPSWGLGLRARARARVAG